MPAASLGVMQWWADLWNNWAKFWGYDRWEWGSAADWLAALGTIGAFAFGFYLLKREISEKRSQHADALVTEATYIRNPFTNEWSVMLEVENTGRYSVTGVSLYQRDKGGPDLINFFGSHEALRWKLRPGKSQRKTTDLDQAPDQLGLFIQFTDVTGREWFRRVDDGRYMSRREYNRVYWGTWFGQPDKRKIREKAGKKTIPDSVSKDTEVIPSEGPASTSPAPADDSPPTRSAEPTPEPSPSASETEPVPEPESSTHEADEPAPGMSERDDATTSVAPEVTAHELSGTSNEPRSNDEPEQDSR